MTQVKTCFDYKMFDVTIGFLASTEKMVPQGLLHIRPLPVSPQGALEISSIIGQPPSLDICHFCTPSMMAEPCK